MPRSLWKGAIGFGLVSVPIQIVPAIEEHDVVLHEVHAEDGGRIRRRRTCDVCGETVPYEHVAKGIEREGQEVVLTDDLMAQLPLPTKKLIDVLAFIDASEIDPIQLDKAYYLQPESAAANKPYVLLRETLKQTDRVAVTKIALRSKESLALLRVHEDLMVIHTMLWPDEVRDATGLAPSSSVTVRPQEVEMAASLMDRMSQDFDLDALEDEYQTALRELVTTKAGAHPARKRAKATAAPSNVVDLMAALQASIDKAEEDVGTPARKSPKKAPAKTAKMTPTRSPKKDAPKKRTG
ncbi:non-homologous end joining protein Ku [Streptomyces abikoensis]|uniref:Non-homologous end joining protein Ku n=1 Tax=Streptomyces abikoensis TaxID=97398 RepID=A0ABW7T9M9_9ACTN